MDPITQDISSIKQAYRTLFEQAHDHLKTLFAEMQTKYTCSQCSQPPEKVDAVLHAGCGYRNWQKSIILTLENDVAAKIVDTLAKIEALKSEKGACHSCGVCCDLASSEFDYQTLLEKAAQGDYFASQFTSVFLPYETSELARNKYPDIVSEILEKTDGNVHFYHCPYLSEDKLCTIYTDPKRPEICATYPETPLTLMYKNCGYQPWKTDQLPTTLWAHATLELCQHYAYKILDAVNASEPPTVAG